jgi:PAS domain S-box-containing protein
VVKSLETDYLEHRGPGPVEDSPSTIPPSPHVATTSTTPVPSDAQPDLYHLLVEQIKDYAIFLLDNEGYVRSWNEGARRINGYEPDEIIGKHFSIFYPRQDLEGEKPQFELRMAREMGRYEEEGWRVRKDGSRFWANVVVTPLRDKLGKMRGFAKVTRDLTQRKFQEEHLQRLLESEERFRLLVEQVRDYAIFFLDARGNISSWNQGARRIKGYTADEIIGKHFSIFYTPEDLADDKPSRELTIAIREGRYEEEGWRLKKDGSRFWASVVITTLWDKRGNLTGFAKVTRDLTLRRREEEAMRARTQELEAFAHSLSHDLRAPLRSISSFSQMLKDEKSTTPEEQKDYLEKIYKSAQSMEALIKDILKLSEVSLAPATTDYVSLDELIAEILALHESQIRDSRARIALNHPLPVIQANRTLLLQIFSNLIANALKFTEPNRLPEINIFAVQRDSEWEIHVKDHGIGIPQELQSSIFDIFNRGSARGDSAGSGIGLAIVKRAVERAGGHISINSQPHEGSDFIVTLPCEIPALATA